MLMLQVWHLHAIGAHAPPIYADAMHKIAAIILASLIGVAAIGVIVMIVAEALMPIYDDSSVKRRLPQQALTPEEMTVTVTPHRDGTIHVAERLIFDASATEDRPLFWSIGGESIGWNGGVGEGGQYAVMPTVKDVTAIELSTDEGSTQTDPAEAADLTVARDDSDVDDPFYDDVRYTITNEKSRGQSSGEVTDWGPGRHVVDFAYVLDDVYLKVEGRDLFVLPLSFLEGTGEAPSLRTISLETGGPLLCLPTNRAFEPDPDCTGLTQGGADPVVEGGTLAWRQLNPVTSIGAVGFDAPKGMSVDPIDVYENKR